MTKLTLRTIILSLTSFLALLLVLAVGYTAWQARSNYVVADRMLEANERSSLVLLSVGNLALERGVTNTALNAPAGDDARFRQIIEDRRRASDATLNRFLALFRDSGHGEGDQLVSEVETAYADVQALRARVDRDLELGVDDRDLDLRRIWFPAMTTLIEKTQELHLASFEQSHDVHSVLSSLNEASHLVWLMSEHAGRERAVIGAAIAAREALSEERRLRLSADRERLELAWQVAQQELASPRLAPAVAAAAKAVEEDFFGAFERTREAVYRAGVAGRPYPVSEEEWIRRSAQAIDTILRLNDAVGDAAVDLAASEKMVRTTQLMVALGVLALGVAIGIAAFFLVERRIVRPLQGMTSAMIKLAAGNLGVEVSSSYQDEIGTMARAVRVFKNHAVQRRRAEGELREAHARLEERVAARTAELTQTNADLKGQIAEREKAEKALRESEARFRVIAHATPVPLAIVRLSDGSMLFANLAFKRTFGIHTGDEGPRQVVDYHVNPAQRAEVLEKLERTGWVREYELGFRRLDGTEFWGSLTSEIVNFDGEPAIFSAIVDISQRRQAELALREREEHLRGIMEHVTDSIITVREDGIIESLNGASERMFGYSRSEMAGRNISLLIPELEDNRHDNLIRRHISESRTKPGGAGPAEVTAHRKDGSTLPLELTIGEMRIDERRLFIGVGRDITWRKDAEREKRLLEAQVLQAQKLESLGTLAGGIAHEINTPVQFVGDNMRFLKTAFADLDTVLQAYGRLADAAYETDSLKDSVDEVKSVCEEADLAYLSEEIPTAIEQSLDGIDRVSRIVLAIKEFSHPDAKQKTLVDLNRAIETTITVARNQWKYVADLETDFDETLPHVPCLAGQFNQVVLNLVVNAAHAIEELGEDTKGWIRISTRRDGDRVEIRVADSGPGVPEDLRQRIFDPFFTTKDPGKGTGQGLAICHTIVTKEHNGTIDVESEAGAGATFIIRLPLDDGSRDHHVSEAAE